MELTEEHLIENGFEESHKETVLIFQKDNIELMRAIDNKGFYISIDGIYELPKVETVEELNEIINQQLNPTGAA